MSFPPPDPPPSRSWDEDPPPSRSWDEDPRPQVPSNSTSRLPSNTNTNATTTTMTSAYSTASTQPGLSPAMPHNVHHLPAMGPGPYHQSMPQSQPIPPPMSHHYPGQYPMVPPQQQQQPRPDAVHDARIPPAASTPYEYIGEQDGRKYKLDVVQQPLRARMCGFGDKDRRPLGPPPCVRLLVTDAATGREVDVNNIEHTMFILHVDLWCEDAQNEVNLVRHTSATPSISSTTPASFAQVDSSAAAYTMPGGGRDMGYGQPAQPYTPTVNPYDHGAYGAPYGLPSNPYGGHQGAGYTYASSNDMQNGVPHPQLGSMGGGSGGHYGAQRIFNGAPDVSVQHRVQQGGHQQNMYTRNLIGSTAGSAYRLENVENTIGIWFVMTDLSVRTEGTFRLRFSFANVGLPAKSANGGSGNQSSMVVNTDRVPVLASCFSDPFQVYSAKKFPGVCESTALSNCFAGQGIKIPVRKNERGGASARDDDDDED